MENVRTMFDNEPMEVQAPPWNKARFKTIFQIYIVTLLAQYICIFASVPLDDIQGRPPLALISSVYVLVMFSLNTCMLPMCSSMVPTVSQFRGLCTSLLLEVVALGFGTVTLVLTWRAGTLRSSEYNGGIESILDVTIYIRSTGAVSLALNVFAAALLAWLCHSTSAWLIKFLLYEQEGGVVKTNDELPGSLKRDQRRLYTA